MKMEGFTRGFYGIYFTYPPGKQLMEKIWKGEASESLGKRSAS